MITTIKVKFKFVFNLLTRVLIAALSKKAEYSTKIMAHYINNN